MEQSRTSLLRSTHFEEEKKNNQMLFKEGEGFRDLGLESVFFIFFLRVAKNFGLGQRAERQPLNQLGLRWALDGLMGWIDGLIACWGKLREGGMHSV